MSAIRPRYKNYLYGISKRKLEDSIQFLGLKSYMILRFGKIITKMSEGHKDAPFTMSAEDSAKAIFNKLEKTGIVYGNIGLYIISVIIKMIPTFLLRRINL